MEPGEPSDPSKPTEDIWGHLLQAASQREIIPEKHLVVVGEPNSGKSSLLAHLQGLDESDRAKAIALEYTFLDVYAADDEDDPISRINVWQLESDSDQRDLLQFAVNAMNFEHCAVVICLDFTTPWKLASSLQTWLSAIKAHIESLNLDPQRFESAQANLVRKFVDYIEPEEGKPRKKPVRAADQPLPPLPEGALTENLGLPIIVVCCKSDAADSLAQQYTYKDAHFEYIHQHLRRICLQCAFMEQLRNRLFDKQSRLTRDAIDCGLCGAIFLTQNHSGFFNLLVDGASLLYTSVRKEKNLDMLMEYIQHVLYEYGFSHKVQLLEKESIFVPAGWDSFAKIQADFENQKLTSDPDAPYDSVISIPPVLLLAKQNSSKLASASAEDDQDFLQRMFSQAQADPSGGNTTANKDVLDAMKRLGILNTPVKASPVNTPSTPTGHDDPSSAVGTPLTTPSKLLPTTPTPAMSSTPLTRTVSSPSTPGGGTSSATASNQAEHAILANFFNSLLAPGGGGSAGQKELNKLQK